ECATLSLVSQMFGEGHSRGLSQSKFLRLYKLTRRCIPFRHQTQLEPPSGRRPPSLARPSSIFCESRLSKERARRFLLCWEVSRLGLFFRQGFSPQRINPRPAQR